MIIVGGCRTQWFLIAIIIISYFKVSCQSRSTSDWIDFGSSHVNKWMQIAPGMLGPNALPVPEMDYGLVAGVSKVEAGFHSHFMEGDTAVNSFLSFNWIVVPEKVEVRFWGNPTETFRMTNEVRDERQIYYDDTGWVTQQGDLWISTRIQILKRHKKLPDIAMNYSFKTTTGKMKHGRYSDAGAHYFYAAAGKSFLFKSAFLDEIRAGILGGFYMWQTNKVEMAQDEGPLLEVGIKIRHKNIWLINEAGGYWGYGAYQFLDVKSRSRPAEYRASLIAQGKYFDWKLGFKTGWNDSRYDTLKFEIVYWFN